MRVTSLEHIADIIHISNWVLDTLRDRQSSTATDNPDNIYQFAQDCALKNKSIKKDKNSSLRLSAIQRSFTRDIVATLTVSPDCWLIGDFFDTEAKVKYGPTAAFNSEATFYAMKHAQATLGASVQLSFLYNEVEGFHRVYAHEPDSSTWTNIKKTLIARGFYE